MRIARLSEITINQIAAGEVVENSASVLKELIENSLDAGATRIQIDLVGGGRQLLRVADNGCGMSPDEVLASLERHATSKLQDVADLDELLSFGFRGEAIPSIGSISRMTICSAEDHRDGCICTVEGGDIREIRVASRERGTTVEVRDLFFNVPARLKFQKTASADQASCSRVVKQLALANPSVHFELRSGHELLTEFLPVADSLAGLKARCEIVLGGEWKKAGILDLAEGPIRLQLILMPPEQHRANRNDQIIMLNRRVVQCLGVGIAIREAMIHRLDPGRYPAFVAAIRLPPAWMDVNVHPQKKEVRLRQEEVMRGLLARATRQILEQTAHAQPSHPSLSNPSHSMWDSWKNRSEERVQHEEPRNWPGHLETSQTSTFGLSPQPYTPIESLASVDTVMRQRPLGPLEVPQPLFKMGRFSLCAPCSEGFWAPAGEGVWIVDEDAMRRCHLNRFVTAEIQVGSQALLIPVEVAVTEEQIQKIGADRLGFEWVAGQEGIRIRAIPEIFSIEEAIRLLQIWVEQESLDQRLWSKINTIKGAGISLDQLIASQTTRGQSKTSLGENFRVWISENRIGEYVHQHG
jgi:DNA mismatch repair protein MutL